MTKHHMDVAKFNTNTQRLYGYAERNGIEIIALNNGIQLRMTRYARFIDFYPSTGRIVGGGKYLVLPEQKAGFTKVMTDLFKKQKSKQKVKCDCWSFYCMDEEVICLHEIFRRHFVEAFTRVEDMFGHARFDLWSDWKARYKNGASWHLVDPAAVKLAIELCKEYGVEMIKI